MAAGKKKRQIAGLYDLDETLGEGHYAVVKLARHVFTGEKVAVKVIDKMKLDAATRVQMFQEVQLMKLVQHPHVVRLYEAIDTHTKLYLVLEYADGGDMYDYIMKHEGGLGEDMARKYFKQIVTAIQYCHKLHVVHRDLKPENVVFFEKLGMVKLTDFGFSNMFNPGQTLHTSCGSLAYSAPEILLGDAYDAPAVDIWSLGVILYMLVCGAAPFQEANDSETLTMIMDCKYTFPKHISQTCKSLISRMLQRQPESRANLEDIINDPWLGGPGNSSEGGEDGSAIPDDEQLPLVSREHLREEEHAYILKKMAQGNIATKEEIIEALDMNEYNHITATYFLLAERKLRAQRHDLAKKMNLKTAKRETARAMATAEAEAAAGKLASSETDQGKSGSSRSRPSQTVDSLLSPDTEPKSSGSGASSRPSAHKRFNRFANISIVEEEEEEECEEEFSDQILALDPPSTRGLSRHSSTSSLADKAASIVLGSSPNSASTLAASIAAGLRGHLNNPGVAAPSTGGSSEPSETGASTPTAIDTPTPFPISSQIGTGGLSISRQNSLRRSEGGGGGGGPSSGASPSSDRKSIPSSPSTPPGSNVSSNQSSPARYKNYLPNKKLVATRSSPQLVLNQIHEEEIDESGGSSASSRATSGFNVDPVDSFPQSAAGAAVIRRLELRRRMHKARTQSCSSSDASDDDSESRKKRNADNAKARTPPTKREHDDSSDSQDPSGVGSSGNPSLLSSSSGAKFHSSGKSSDGTSATTQGGSGGGGSGSTGGGGTKRMHHHGSRRHRAALQQGSRIRQSHSLNRISELHVADFSSDHYHSDDVSNNNNISCCSSSSSTVYPHSPQQPPSNVVSQATPVLPPIPPHRQITPQLFTESDSESSNGQRFDMLSRYLESLTVIKSHSNLNNSRSRDDSQNSSDGELDQVETICPTSGKVVSRPSAATRRHKVNLRVLEQRLNKIQEECNKSEDEEEGEVDEDGELSDDPSTLPDETESRQEMNEVENNLRNLDCNTTQNHNQTIMEICDNNHKLNNSGGYYNNQDFFHDTETASTKSCDVISLSHLRATAAVAVAAAAHHHHHKRPLHRAHSCGSLMSLKEKAMLAKNLQPLLWDPFELLKGSAVVPALNEDTDTGGGKKDITLGLATAAATPLTILQLQSSSRCCNLC